MVFSDELASLCSREAIASKDDPSRMAEMIERLTHCLGFTVGIAAKTSEEAQELLTGIENQLYLYAVDSAPFPPMMKNASRRT